MNFLDIRTVLFSYLLSNGICTAVMTFLWLSNRRRYAGLGFWLADFVLQLFALALLAFRGFVPVPVSIMLSGPLVIVGTVLLYRGLGHFNGNKTTTLRNYFLLTALTAFQAYFTFVQPSLLARNINFEIGLLAICSQAAWLMLRRLPPEYRSEARLVAFVFGAYGLSSLTRISANLIWPPGQDLFTSGSYNAAGVMAHQMLFIALTFSLFLMLNRRLVVGSELAAAEYRTLADSGQALIWTAGTDKLCNYFNQPWLSFTGRTLQQELGNGWTEGVHREDFDRCLRTYVAAFERREPFSMEYRLRHGSGEYRWIQDDGTPRFDGHGNFLGYIGHCLDITGRKRVEAEARDREHRLQVLMSNLPGMAYRCLNTPDWPMQFVSEGSIALTGYHPEELMTSGGTQYGDLIHPEDRDYVFRTVQECIRENRPFQLEYRINTKQGQLVNVWEQGRLVSDADSTQQWVEGFIADITQKKQTEEALAKQAEELMEGNRELVRFNRAAVGRELRMIELKQEVNECCRRLNEALRYQVARNECSAPASTKVQS